MGCLNDETVIDFVEKRLDPAKREEVARHLDECSACRELVARTAEALLSTRGEFPEAALALVPLAPGARVGRYLVLQTAGAGGMGLVYAAYDPELDRKVALKLLRPDRADDNARLRDRLLREAQALAKLSHPAVVGVFDVGTVGEQIYLAMEYVDGTTLSGWLQQADRSPRDVLEKLVQAGRGLAAAHAAGLVHRDFKPDNVLVGRDGRVRVTDFGLARTAALVAPPSATAKDSSERLTQTRAVVGTPLYMAPEQMSGGVVDARADIFAFCVTSFEALYGIRPHAGDSIDELLASRLDERIREPPRGLSVPAHVRRALQRGLKADPSQRPVSMEALLRELTRDPLARWKRLAWLAALVGAVGVVSLVQRHMAQSQAQLCRGSEERLLEVWNPGRKASIHAAFSASSLPFAERTFAGVAAALDSYGVKWVASRTEACRATRMRGEQSEQMLDQRMACLDRRLRDLDGLASLLGEGEPKVIENAMQAALSIASPSSCDHPETGSQAVPRSAPGIRAPVEQLISQAKAHRDAGKYQQSRALALRAIDSSQEADADLRVEGKWIAGEMADKVGEFERAQAMLEDSAFEAIRSGLDELAARAMISLVSVIGYRRAQPAQGLLWGRQADALIARLDRADPLRAELLHRTGVVRRADGKYREAVADLEKSLELSERALGRDHHEVASVLAELAGALRDDGRNDAAMVQAERALSIRERTLGPDHPLVASALRVVADLAWRRGNFPDALRMLERAMLVQTSAGDHLEVAYTRNQIGNVLGAEGLFNEALPHYRAAREAGERALGPDHPEVAMARSNEALALVGAARFAEGLAVARQCVAVLERTVGSHHHYLAMVLAIAGDGLCGTGKRKEALETYRRAIAIDEEVLGKDRPELGDSLTGLGECLVNDGRAREAVGILQRAWRVRTAGTPAPNDWGRTRFALARALWESGERKAGMEMASEAVGLFPAQSAWRATAQGWLNGREYH